MWVKVDYSTDAKKNPRPNKAGETLHNPNFKPTDFGRFLSESGSNAFTMSPKDRLIRQSK